LTSVMPKCGSVMGGSQVTFSINIDENTSTVLQDLKIGFQAKRQSTRATDPDGKIS